jgi:WhiB family redox-sensing transcriptional regulator
MTLLAYRELVVEKWRLKRMCIDQNLDMFFPEDQPKFKVENEPGNPGSFCFQCPVRKECLDYAVQNEIRHGVWGGVNEETRNRLINLRIKQRRTEARIRRRTAQSLAAQKR